MKIHTVINKLAGTTTKDGTYYELQEATRYDESEEIVLNYDGSEKWYRVAITSPLGMLLRYKEFGPDEAKAYKYLKNRR